MKICKAIKVCGKLAKSALHDAAPAVRRGALRPVKALRATFRDELRARSETTSLRRAAAAIADANSRDAARQLEFVADLASDYLGVRHARAKKDEVSAVAIVRTLALHVRTARAVRGAVAGTYQGNAGRAVQLA